MAENPHDIPSSSGDDTYTDVCKGSEEEAATGPSGTQPDGSQMENTHEEAALVKAFQDLRKVVLSIQDQPDASSLRILQESYSYIVMMQNKWDEIRSKLRNLAEQLAKSAEDCTSLAGQLGAVTQELHDHAEN